MSVKGKVLTQELVFNKTKSDNLHSIKNLNLWGNELEDLQLIERMPNLEVISLSVNKISSLKDFAKCSKLQVLLKPRRNSIYARTASPISGRSDTLSNSPPSKCYGFTIIHVPQSKITEKSSYTTSPISSSSTTTSSPQKKNRRRRRLSSISWWKAWKTKATPPPLSKNHRRRRRRRNQGRIHRCQ